MEASSSRHGRKYKSRKERPCDACRRRKVCCIRDSGDEACSLCRTSGQVCSYDQGPTPRRRRPQPVVAGLPGNHTSAMGSAAVADAGASTSTLSQAEHVVTDGQAPGPRRTEWISQYVGPSGDLDPFVLMHSTFSQSDLHKTEDFACLRVRVADAPPAMFVLVPEHYLSARPAHYPSSDLLDTVYPLHHELLTTYFEVIHTSYPILDPSRFTKGNEIDLPLLAAMYGLSMPFCPAAKDTIQNPLHDYVSRALSTESRAPHLETIETALLFIQRHPEAHRTPPLPGVYPDIGALVGMSHDLGLNVDPSGWNLPPLDRSRRKRLWWSTYIVDKWAAFGLGRPSFIHDDGFTVPLPTPEDLPATMITGTFLPCTCSRMFVAMAALTQILSTILSTFYTTKSVEKLGAATAEEIGRLGAYFDMQLANFRARYLSELLRVSDIFLDSTGTLFLAFHTVKIAVHKAVLGSLPPSEPLCQQIRSQVKVTIDAISTQLENLQVTRLRAFWWSPISRSNFSMAGSFMFSMLLSSVTEEEVEYWTNEITRYRRLLDMHSLSFETTKLASARMNALASVGQAKRDNTTPSSSSIATLHQTFCRDFGLDLTTA
ncbi:hypothetical protein DOTSEDRAFT_53722 [Dothistroma septosporum NZE10]|uniref:Zn(2)-C6 fungal-type domain-containing protein n=1 Tax=Dothistroma septosporum (strain NZE10 / CBS 128990) TaxID=675120 RepID=N1PQT2_DOTSN|nr:hypothetical protein DOTSEDRAFT_53722 [Dothistroma septosporum NZE10]